MYRKKTDKRGLKEEYQVIIVQCIGRKQINRIERSTSGNYCSIYRKKTDKRGLKEEYQVIIVLYIGRKQINED